MHFTKHQKAIITKIATGEITDIPSYLKVFNLTTFHQINREDVEQRLRAEEDGKTYKKLKDNVETIHMNTTYETDCLGLPIKPNISITPIIPKEEDYEYISAKLDYSGISYSVEVNESTKFRYDYFAGINVSNSFSDIKEFLTIWQFLKSERLVLEVEKEVQKRDYEPFFEYKPIEETEFGKRKKKESTDNNFSSAIINGKENTTVLVGNKNFHFLPFSDSSYIKNYRNYIDFGFEYNKSNELICSQFINKQIYGNSELEVFIKKGFRTTEQINFKRALIPAYLAVAVTLGIAIWQKVSDDNSDVAKIQNQLAQIQETLENDEKPDLSIIEEKLQSIIDSHSSNLEIEQKLDEIIEELKKQ